MTTSKSNHKKPNKQDLHYMHTQMHTYSTAHQLLEQMGGGGLVSSWILTSHQLPRVTSGQSNSGISKFTSETCCHINTHLFSSQSTKPVPNRRQNVHANINFQRVSLFNPTLFKERMRLGHAGTDSHWGWEGREFASSMRSLKRWYFGAILHAADHVGIQKTHAKQKRLYKTQT